MGTSTHESTTDQSDDAIKFVSPIHETFDNDEVAVVTATDVGVDVEVGDKGNTFDVDEGAIDSTARPPSTPDQGAIFLIVTVVAMAFQHEVIKSASSKFCTLIFPCACTCSPVKRLRAQKFDAAFASADQSRGVHCLLQITYSLRPLECFCKNGGCSKGN